jgi:PAS domain S-box-containing protein
VLRKETPAVTSNDSTENGLARVEEASDRLYRKIVESTRDYAIFMLDPSGQVMTWTEGARAIKGYSASEIIGAHFSRFYPEEQIARGWPDYELAQASALGRFEDENWRIRKDGSRFWANVIITALRDDAGELIGFAKVTRDLTDRRAHEESLRESEERFRLLVENVKDYAIFMLDTDGFVTTWNAGAESLKGYKADEIIGSHISRFYPPDAIKRAWPAHELRMATMDGRFEDEGWRIRKDGSRFWASVVITALRDSHGTLKGFSKITRDLTERRLAEQKLAESEELFRLLVQGVTDYAVIMLDHGGVVTTWNTGAESITGFPPVEVVGKHFSHFYTSEDIRASKPWQQLLAANETGRFADESWRVRKDGTQFWASTVISAIHDSEGKHRGYVLVMQDLTSRKHAETLANTTRRMHEFIAMLAHELRNPLAPIRNAVELMRRRGLGDPTLEAMRDTIDRQVTTLTRIIDDLLDVNRIARGHFSIGHEKVDLREVVVRAVESSKPLLDSFGHTLSVTCAETPIELHGDALRLTQAFANLLNNAAKYTPPGGRVGVTVEQRETDVVVRIADTGRGIEEPDLERIFDLFTQVDPQFGHDGGLGVGLALVRRVIELHAGTVRAQSGGRGQGSEFIVVLPLPLERPALVASNAKPASTKPLRRLRVLVVDDNRDAAESLRLFLQALGQDSYAVFDGKTALEAVDRLRPHLLLLDIGMPGMSGYEVADAVRTALGKDAPVLAAVTGWGQEADRRVAQARGFNYHFTKPVSTAALQEILTAVAETRLEPPSS